MEYLFSGDSNDLDQVLSSFMICDVKKIFEQWAKS